MKAALLPIREPYTEWILSGLKTVEIRKRPLDKWQRIYMYQTGGDRLIVGRFDIARVFTAVRSYLMLHETALSEPEWDDYADGSTVYGHDIHHPHRFPTPVKWAKAPPQSVQTLHPTDLAWIEQAGNLQSRRFGT